MRIPKRFTWRGLCVMIICLVLTYFTFNTNQPLNPRFIDPVVRISSEQMPDTTYRETNVPEQKSLFVTQHHPSPTLDRHKEYSTESSTVAVLILQEDSGRHLGLKITEPDTISQQESHAERHQTSTTAHRITVLFENINITVNGSSDEIISRAESSRSHDEIIYGSSTLRPTAERNGVAALRFQKNETRERTPGNPASPTAHTIDGIPIQICSPHHHIAFVKVHKAASSTVANILQRYGYTRDLTFVLPKKKRWSVSYNYLSRPYESLTSDRIFPHAKGGHYDILWNHAIYNRTAFRAIMPPDTRYLAILREPFEQFVSTFAYYEGITPADLNSNGSSESPRGSNPIADFLRSGGDKHLLSYYRNKQAEDMGMRIEHVLNSTLRAQYIQQLAADFDLVMITEHFNESLILLRRMMCWDLKDVLYMPQNENVHRRGFVFDNEDRQRHQVHAAADYELYEFFKEKFRQKLQAQREDFQEEVVHFQEVLKQIHYYCWEQLPLARQSVSLVKASIWNPEFVLDSYDCELMMLPELDFLDSILNRLENIPVETFEAPWPRRLINETNIYDLNKN